MGSNEDGKCVHVLRIQRVYEDCVFGCGGGGVDRRWDPPGVKRVGALFGLLSERRTPQPAGCQMWRCLFPFQALHLPSRKPRQLRLPSLYPSDLTCRLSSEVLPREKPSSCYKAALAGTCLQEGPGSRITCFIPRNIQPPTSPNGFPNRRFWYS